MKEFQQVLDNLSKPENTTFISFDIDSIASTFCPGVSCPAVIGLISQEALDICFAAGKCGNIRFLDISEFNPDIEEDRTGRLVATVVYYFLMGIADRVS